jgi:hypothetical protein
MKTRSWVRSVAYSAVTVLIALLVLEGAASWMMLVYYRATDRQKFETDDPSYLSVVNLARRFSRLIGLSESTMVLEESSPSPFFRADPLLGYSAAPGVYTHSYARWNSSFGEWQYFRNKVTINPDGTRWVGAPRPGKPTVYIFGDSWVFGNGVPDELTFAARLYEALPDWNVRLVALGGYSLTQAWLTFEGLREIRPDDIVILGYADYFDVRHVEAPSRLLEIERWLERTNQPSPPFQLPKATLASGGAVTIGYIDQRCAVLGDYCRRSDPSQQEMTDVTAALVNQIAVRSPAKVYLLHFAGSPNNPVRRKVSPKVQVIGALPSEFGSVVQDDIIGFDGHPGPFWHYAISRKLLDSIAWQQP